eukprot:CAMPEP_0182906414 /NCGR_PEP_ID=MMETSP0034_2-20130328/33709_1 /TAXON_ID=156128 /ORGANISM="Nephroselmis pyriformis, Strain CCMP717" /LENGTH=218 /DNA_ID=CAMNT_0025042079 /DNA_START=1262 /DNA_END=1919 /DNA_ORIENTATION=+
MDELPDDICQHRRGGSPHPPHHDVVSAVVGVVPLRLPRESVVIELATLLGDRNLPLGLAPARAPSVHLLSGDVPQGLVRGGVVKVLVALAINGLGPPVAVIPAADSPPRPPSCRIMAIASDAASAGLCHSDSPVTVLYQYVYPSVVVPSRHSASTASSPSQKVRLVRVSHMKKAARSASHFFTSVPSGISQNDSLVRRLTKYGREVSSQMNSSHTGPM